MRRPRQRASLALGGGCLLALASCLSDSERCERLLALALAKVASLADGCATAADCTPLRSACGRPSAVRLDADTRDVTGALERYERVCGCHGEAPALPPATCIAGECRPRPDPPPRPPACDELREEMREDVDRQNRCAADADCATFNILTCPPLCGRPTARGAEPGRVAFLLAEYNGISGCRDCEPSCGTAPRSRCVSGLCAADEPVPGECAALGAEIDRLAASRTCRAYADCAFVDYRMPIGDRCGAAASRADAPRLALHVEAWRGRCCAGCPQSCPALPPESARCEASRCIAASECPRRFAAAPAGWTLTYRAPSSDGLQRTLLLRHEGSATLTPPGVQRAIPAQSVQAVVQAADAAAVLCLDDSFHRAGDAPVELVASLATLARVTLRYAPGDARPSGLTELERVLGAIARMLGAP